MAIQVPTRETLQITALLEMKCCTQTGDESVDTSIAASTGGAQLARFICHKCGAEYLIGVIAKTREESLASEVFDKLSEDEEEKAGIDRTDFEPSPDGEIYMCSGCDGQVDRNTDYCNGCKEYVCQSCRKRETGSGRHPTDEHWQAPKFVAVKTEKVDDGSSGDEPDYAAGFRPEVD